ncbi:MAG: hypothetical protein H9893_09795 [Candidatus Niameybacter stercoravium]|nr:hypothetical protein [Candidatus Niameybacter stercoravium]
MSYLTTKELVHIQDLLHHEILSTKKFHMLAEATQDPELREQLLSLASKHQDHFDKLYAYLC